MLGEYQTIDADEAWLRADRRPDECGGRLGWRRRPPLRLLLVVVLEHPAFAAHKR